MQRAERVIIVLIGNDESKDFVQDFNETKIPKKSNFKK